MMKIHQKYIELIKKNKECNFVSQVVTPWHALGVDAFLNHMKNKNISINGYVFVTRFDSQKYVDDSNFIFKKNFSILKDLNETTNLVGKIAVFISIFKYFFNYDNYSNDFFYVVNPANIDLKWFYIVQRSNIKRRIKFIIIDEGIGSVEASTLAGTIKWCVRDEIFSKGNSSIIKIIKIIYDVIKTMMMFAIKKLLYKKGDLIIRNILLVENKKVVKNSEIVNDYSRVLSLKQNNGNDYLNSILLNPDPSQNFICDEIKLYENVIKKIKNYDFIIKLHPREQNDFLFEQLNATIINKKSCSQEELLANTSNKPVCVISIASSSLINLKLLYDIRTISLAKIVLKSIQSNKTKRGLNNFIAKYKDIVLFPETIEEINALIE